VPLPHPSVPCRIVQAAGWRCNLSDWRTVGIKSEVFTCSPSNECEQQTPTTSSHPSYMQFWWWQQHCSFISTSDCFPAEVKEVLHRFIIVSERLKRFKAKHDLLSPFQ
jgi:hypothetical protein